MDKEHLDQWMKFLSGHWTLEIPQRRGKYFLATRDGLPESIMGVVYLDPDEDSVFKSAKHWEGYWWSEPTPDLPRPGATNEIMWAGRQGDV